MIDSQNAGFAPLGSLLAARRAGCRPTLNLSGPEDRREAQARILRAVASSVPKRSLINLSVVVGA